MSCWFPFHYRDVAAWHAEGMPISTTSDEAAKMFDAATAQIVLMDSDPQLGGLEATFKRIFEADPTFMLPRIVMEAFAVLGQDTVTHPELLQKLHALKRESEHKELSQWERDHVKAWVAFAENDILTACRTFERILESQPKDALALSNLFFGCLTMGRRQMLRDAVYRVAHKYKPGDRYYANIHAKLCFGFEENGQYDEAAKSGELSLSITPKDIWATHSMSHVYEETARPHEGIDFLTKTEAEWGTNGPTNSHVYWHKALHHYQLSQFEDVVTLYDQKIQPLAFKYCLPFPMSNAASLLLRLELEGQPKGISLKDRWREVAQMYATKMQDSGNNIFYDWHAQVACLYGDQPSKASSVLSSTRKQAALADTSASFNARVARYNGGLELLEATVDFVSDGNFAAAAEKLINARHELDGSLGASGAQRHAVEMLTLSAALAAGNMNSAEQLLRERQARKEGLTRAPPAGSYEERMWQKISEMH